MEEEMMNILHLLASGSFKSKAMDLYFQTCKPRFEQLSSFSKLGKMNESDHLAKVLIDLVGNPIHMYSLMDRLVIQLPLLRTELLDHLGSVDIRERFLTHIESIRMPNENDLEVVTQAIARIQFAYRLDPVEMAEGKIQEVQTKGRLSVRQMMNIAEKRISGKQPLRPYIGKEYALAIEWAEGALILANKTENDDPQVSLIMTFLQKARIEHNNNWQSPQGQRGNYPNEEFFVRRIQKRPKLTTGKLLRVEESYILKETLGNLNAGWLKQGYNIHDFYALCRGDFGNNLYSSATPTCKFTTKNDPYFLLAPLKLEIVSEKPLLHLYHDIITDEEINLMTTRIVHQLHTSATTDKVTGDSKMSNERTQSSGWLWDQDNDFLYKLSKKTGKFAQLETARPNDLIAHETYRRVVESEPWQIGLYGPGGHYLPHYDTFEAESLPFDAWSTNRMWVGNRIATVMFYMSDVIGGKTAFPKLGLATSPKKGTAVFWYNLQTDGRRDHLSHHGACPTALGIKWVSNKWIREGAQLWKMQCNE